MMKRVQVFLLSMAMLLSIALLPGASSAEGALLGASVLSIRVDAAVVEIFDAPGEEPVFSYEPSRYTVIREMVGDTLSITIEPRRKHLHGGDTMQVYLPLSDYSAIHVEANASGLTFPPFNADLDAVVNASVFTCYLPGNFSHDLHIEANASAVETYLHSSFQDFTLWTDETVSIVSLPNGMKSGDRLGEGSHTLDFQAIASSVDITWYTDATPIPHEQPPATSAPADDSNEAQR